MMDRSFSPRHNFQRSPNNFQSRFRMQSNHQQHNQNTQQGMQFHSPHSSPNIHQRNSFQSPEYRQRNAFELSSPNNSNFPSPQFHSSPRMYSPRHRSQFMGKRNSLNNSWNNPGNLSANSSANSSTYFADISMDSSADSSAYFEDLSGSPQYASNKQKFRSQRKHHSADNDSNPGHSENIDDYIHPSMLEDPWAKDMIEYNKRKRSLCHSDIEADTS